MVTWSFFFWALKWVRGWGLPHSVLSGSDGREDLDCSGLDELKGLRKGSFFALPQLDVIGGCGAGAEANCLTDHESNGFGFRFANCLGGFGSPCVFV